MNKKLKLLKEMNSTKIPCDRCGKISYAYYTLSRLTKALYIVCERCHNHAAPYKDQLPIPFIPSKDYLLNVLQPTLIERSPADSQTEGEVK